MARKPRSKEDGEMLNTSDMTIEERIARIETEMEDIENVPREMFKLQGRFERLSKDFDEIAEGASAEDLEQVQRSLEDMSDRFKSVEETLEAKSSQMEASEAEISGRIESLHAETSEIRSEVSKLDASVNERLDLLKEEISNAPEFAKKDDLEAYKNEQSAAADALKENLDADISSVKNDIEELKNEIEVNLKENSKALEENLTSKIADTESSVAKVEEFANKISEELAFLRESLDGADNAAEKLKSTNDAVENLKSRLDVFAPRFEEAIAQAEEAKNAVEEHLSAIKMAMRLVEQLDARVSDIGKSAEAVAQAAANAVEAAPKIAATVAQAASSVPSASLKVSAAEEAEDIPVPPVSENLGYELGDILQVVISNNASDLHLQVGTTPTVRLNGDLIPVGDTKLAQSDTKALIFPAMTREQRAAVIKGKEVSFVHTTAEGIRFMVSAFLERGNVSASFHLLRTEAPAFETLGLPPVLKKLSLYQNGLIVFTGLSGSGKSATIASIVDFINNNRKCHIVTVEEPIEYYHKNVNSLITQREVGTDTATFKDGINMAMRQDPDILVIGEIKDSETLMSAVVAAEKGYLVLCSMNTPDTVQTVRRMVSMFSGDAQRQFRLLLANSLRGVISQKLVNRADDKGRIPAVEVLVGTVDLSSMIMEDNFEGISVYLQHGNVEGMQSFGQAMNALYSQGLINKDEEIFREDIAAAEFAPVQEEHVRDDALDLDGGETDTIMEWL